MKRALVFAALLLASCVSLKELPRTELPLLGSIEFASKVGVGKEMEVEPYPSGKVGACPYVVIRIEGVEGGRRAQLRLYRDNELVQREVFSLGEEGAFYTEVIIWVRLTGACSQGKYLLVLSVDGLTLFSRAFSVTHR